jgi:hypothetical protein
MLLLTLALLAAPPDMKQAASAVTTLVAAELGETKSVLSGQDVKKLMEAASNAQLAGCDVAASCISEIASALGTRFVVSGRLNQVGSFFVLEASLLDSQGGVILDRASLKRATLDEIQASLTNVVSRLHAKLPEDATTILVLDFETTQTAVVGVTEAEVQGSALSIASFIAGGVGIATLVAAYGYLAYRGSYFYALNPGTDDGIANPYGVFIPVVGPFTYSEFDNPPLIEGRQDLPLLGALQVGGFLLGAGGIAGGFVFAPAATE